MADAGAAVVLRDDELSAAACARRRQAARRPRHLAAMAARVARCSHAPAPRASSPARSRGRTAASLAAVTDDDLGGPAAALHRDRGAGMCGLALVGQALGAEVTGSDRAPTRRRSAPPRAPGSSRSWATTPPTSQRTPRSSSPRVPAGEPRARGRPRARPESCTAPTCSARSPRCGRDRGHRHARQDDDVEHGRARAARPGWTPPTSSAARSARPARTPAGGRGSGSSSRPTSPTARC